MSKSTDIENNEFFPIEVFHKQQFGIQALENVPFLLFFSWKHFYILVLKGLWLGKMEGKWMEENAGSISGKTLQQWNPLNYKPLFQGK